MTRICVFTVETTELSKPPDERTYEQLGLYDTSEACWTESTSPRLRCVVPEEDGPYSLSQLRDILESPTTRVCEADQAPETVVDSSSEVDEEARGSTTE